LFDGDGEDETGIYPTPASSLGGGGQSVDVQQALQSFEGEFDIPLTLPLIN
jgi:hypothetical protein